MVYSSTSRHIKKGLFFGFVFLFFLFYASPIRTHKTNNVLEAKLHSKPKLNSHVACSQQRAKYAVFTLVQIKDVKMVITKGFKMSSSRETRLFYLLGTSDYLLPLVGSWLQFVKLRLPQLEATFIPLLALLFAVIVWKGICPLRQLV